MFGLWGIAVGILLLLLGIFLVFFFPAADEYHEGWGIFPILLGFFFLIVGVILVFL